jgi:hypothetical protein
MALKYKTFDSLVDAVSEDLRLYDDNNLIKPSSLIRIVRKINADLGLSIQEKGHCFIPISNYEADLPKDFFSALMAFGVTAYNHGVLDNGIIYGTHTSLDTKEEIISKQLKPGPDVSACLTECGGCYWVTRKTVTGKPILQDKLIPLTPTSNSLKCFDKSTPNTHWRQDGYNIDIQDEKINVSFRNGEIYLEYYKNMVDEGGNLMVLDHPLTDDYYYWALKVKILEDIYYNTEADVQNKLQDARNQLIPARGAAKNIVNDPDYKVLKQYKEKVSSDFHKRYVKMFI